jgi:ATP-dependent Zn protease
MTLAASAAERLILGQGTMGAGHDLSQATGAAYARLNAGLDPEAPLFCTNGVPFNLMPAAIVDEFGRAVVATLSAARERADALVAIRRAAIMTFASRLYERRRLTGGEIDDLIASLNLRPTTPGADHCRPGATPAGL